MDREGGAGWQAAWDRAVRAVLLAEVAPRRPTVVFIRDPTDGTAAVAAAAVEEGTTSGAAAHLLPVTEVAVAVAVAVAVDTTAELAVEDRPVEDRLGAGRP